MTSPYTWDIAKPAGADGLNAGDDQLRADKTTVRDVLRTLVPYGTPTDGWRNIQITNDHYLVQNAKFDGSVWSHDDTTLDATGFLMLSTGEVRMIFRKAAASTWASSAWLISGEFTSTAAAVDYVRTTPGAAGNPATVTVAAVGTDANIHLNLVSKGTGIVQANGTAIVPTAPTVTFKTGSGSGNYTTASATYVDIDGTNLAYTVTVPTGQKVLISASVRFTLGTNNTGAQFAITDSTTVLKESATMSSGAAGYISNEPLFYVFTGDGASHTFKLRYHSDGGVTLTVYNAATSSAPVMMFWMGVAS